ncbi:MAG TPA: hypothetical protein VE567_07410 [Sphingomonas sp.]|nr:hypothetical protein [Sphingomonas sp.]
MAIISFEHRLIFIKTLKTGGTSLEIELARRLGADAVVTPVIPSVEGHRPRNYRRGLMRRPFYNHIPAARVRQYLGRARYDGMYKFCVEREPVRKCISFFHMLRNSPDHRRPGSERLSWTDYVAAGEFPIDLDRYSAVESGRRVLLVDEVIPYEEMQKGLDTVMRRVGIEPFPIAARAKGDYAGERVIGPKDVTAEQRARIYAAFEPSLRIAGLWDRYAGSPASAA